VALVVLDASVVIALLDATDAFHLAAKNELDLHADADLMIPASAYSESLVGPAKRGQVATIKKSLARLAIEVSPITDQIAERAADIRAQHSGLRLPDALVVATGLVLKADWVVTADAAWRRLGKGISILRQSSR
jgi:predicted nucleic acid-binding protein